MTNLSLIRSKDALDNFLKQLSIDNVYNNATYISNEFYWRLSGSENAERASRYYAKLLKEYGLKTDLLEFDALVDLPAPAKLKITAPFEIEIDAAACAQAGSTPDEGIEAELIYAGNGAVNDYKGIDAKGKIALVEMSYEPPRPEKTRIAMENGCVGVIILNWGSDDNPWQGFGTCKAVWGNPTPETYPLMANTPPVLLIKRPDGIMLRDKLKKGEKITAYIHTVSQRQWKRIYMPTGFIEAPNGDGNFLIVAAHMDSWAHGASDNATGNSCKLELARVLYQNREKLKHNVRFVFWQCHENGIMEGSSWFVDRFWDEIDSKCIGYFNFDTSGVAGTTVWRSDTSSELYDWHRAIEDHIIPGVERERRKVERTGDQSFFGIGVPAICCWMVHKKEEIKEWNSASLGVWYHSEGDTMEQISKEVLHTCLKVYGGYVWEMLTTPILPMRFAHVADDIIERLQYYKKRVQKDSYMEDFLELDKVIGLAKEFRLAAADFEDKRPSENSERINAYNKTIQKVSRTIMPAKCTVSGRYDQDTYGLTSLLNDLPGLAGIDNWLTKKPRSNDYYLWATRCRRERNRVSDALRHAANLLNEY